MSAEELLAAYYVSVANGGSCDECDGDHGTSDHVDLADPDHGPGCDGPYNCTCDQ